MLMVKATGYSEAGVSHDREYKEDMSAYKKSLAKAGVLLAAEELQPSSTGLRISYSSRGREPQVLAGPFPIDQELIAEYVLIDARTEDEALEWAFRMPVPTSRGECQIEVRRLEENSGSMRNPRIQAMEADLMDQLDMLQTLDKRD
jgi:hypothetical protein